MSYDMGLEMRVDRFTVKGKTHVHQYETRYTVTGPEGSSLLEEASVQEFLALVPASDEDVARFEHGHWPAVGVKLFDKVVHPPSDWEREWPGRSATVLDECLGLDVMKTLDMVNTAWAEDRQIAGVKVTDLEIQGVSGGDLCDDKVAFKDFKGGTFLIMILFGRIREVNYCMDGRCRITIKSNTDGQAKQETRLNE
jgi:hypothetical protein